MALNKSALYSSLWASCDQLRGGMDTSQYQDSVLWWPCWRPKWQYSFNE
jgi:type I restriction-modification system DNA methylase subunit